MVTRLVKDEGARGGHLRKKGTETGTELAQRGTSRARGAAGGRSGNCVPPRWGGCENLATSSLDGRRATHLSTISKRRGWIWRASSPSLASRTSRRVMFSISIASPARDVGRDATAVSHSAPTEGMERWTSRRFVPPPAWECASVPARSAARSLVADRSGAPMHCLPPLTQRYAVRDGGNARWCLPTADVQTAGGKNPQRSPPSSHEKIFPNFTEVQSENFAGKNGHRQTRPIT